MFAGPGEVVGKPEARAEVVFICLREAAGVRAVDGLESEVAAILRLLASGDTLSDIAEKLGIAYKTVANTLSRIKEKLGVGQTSDLVRIAVSRGLVDMI